ncbi:C40 family peptidase [Alphaproteobacteria bacterium]|nr:C40 family peptidase [Alphaproteobacteria bacterium]
MLSAGDIAQVITATSDIHEHTNDLKIVKPRDSQLLLGERFQIELIDGDWAFGTCMSDGYEGFVTVETLRKHEASPTHIVSNILSHIYPEPTFKVRPTLQVSFKSEILCRDKNEGGFVEVPGFGWIPVGHIAPIGSFDSIVARDIALNFLSTPYLYGGRSALGLDCSGLTQVVLQTCGVDCPRDSDQQLEKGESGKPDDLFLPGDLVFFKGHVGIMVDTQHILNATSRTMDTRIEPLDELEKIYGGILGYWRV